eukprot:m51a1_g14476 hypothetical protein (411) ;mRNA; r:691981-694445
MDCLAHRRVCSNVLQCTPINDIPGHDTTSFNVTGGDVECTQCCRAIDWCTGFAYWNNRCWLKSGDITLAPSTRHEGICSGAIQCTPNTDNPGSVISQFEAPRGSAECADRCRNTMGCKVFMHWRSAVQLTRVHRGPPNVDVHDTPMGDGQCADRCRSTLNCTGFTYWAGRCWLKSGDFPSSTVGCTNFTYWSESCWLKSGDFPSFADDANHPVCTAGLQSIPTVNAAGNNIADFAAPHSDNECADRCRKTQGCTGFTYWAGRCFLKSGQFPSFHDPANDQHPGICTAGLQCSQATISAGTDLAHVDTLQGDSKCADFCMARDACTGFTFLDGRCSLKTGGFPVAHDDGSHPGVCTRILGCKPNNAIQGPFYSTTPVVGGERECSDLCLADSKSTNGSCSAVVRVKRAEVL